MTTTSSQNPVIMTKVSGNGVRIVQQGHKILIADSREREKTLSYARYSLYNLQGRIVRSWLLHVSNSMAVDISDCLSGSYYGSLVLRNRHYGSMVIISK
jgi:hypothetical protein